jgi:hypothetical protein
MRQTHGFQNQAAGLKVQAPAVTEVARARETGSSSKQQVEAHLESQENPKRRRRSDDEYTNPTNHPLDMMTPKPTKRNKELTGEYSKPITMTIPHSDTPASGSGDAATLTTNEANTTQTLDTIPMKNAKRTKEYTDKFAEPITTTTPQGDNPEAGINGTASLTTFEEETHNLQTQTGSTDEVWQSQRNPKSDKVPNSPTPGTSSKQQVETLIENLGNRKRKRGSDDELPHPTTLLLDTIIPWPAKRNRGFTGAYVEPKTTTTHQDDIPASGSRNAASLTTNEAEKGVLTNVSFSPVAQTTHGLHPRAAETHDSDSLTDTSPSQPDTKKYIQVERETYAVTSQPGTSYTFDPGIDTATCGVLVGRKTIALMPIEKYAATTPHIDTPKQYRKPRSGSDKKQKNTRSRDHQLP